MSYLDDDRPDPDRRALLLAIGGGVPIVGGVIELLARVLARPAEREAAKLTGRAILAHEAEPRLRVDKAIEAAANRPQDGER